MIYRPLIMLLVHQLIYLVCASYTKYVKLFFKVCVKEKLCHYLPGDMGRPGYNEKSGKQ